MRERKLPDVDPFATARKRQQDDLDRLRREFYAGDPMALNEAYKLYGGMAAGRWVADAIHACLNAEFEKSPRGKKFERDFLRWSIYSWLINKKFLQEDAKDLGGSICDCDGETLYASYKNFRKEHGFPHGPQPELKGFEEIAPDILGGHVVRERVFKWYCKKSRSHQRAERLTSQLLTPSLRKS